MRHNGAESDGAANVLNFPGTFYDYRWSTTLARRDTINVDATDRRASGPDGNGGLVKMAGFHGRRRCGCWRTDRLAISPSPARPCRLKWSRTFKRAGTLPLYCPDWDWRGPYAPGVQPPMFAVSR
jgi:hypothetical protein